MKNKLSLILPVMVLILGISSCVTDNFANMSGTQRAETASITMELVENDIKLLVLYISITNSTLQSLIQPDNVDIEKSYKEYTLTFDDMKETTDRFFIHVDRQNFQIREYFEGWRTQGNAFSNSEVRALSEQRRVDLNAINAHIGESSVGVRGSLENYISITHEIRNYFSADLTPKGVAAIGPVAQNAIDSGVSLISSLEQLHAAIAAFRAEISTSVDK